MFKVGEHCTILWPIGHGMVQCTTSLNIYTGFIPTQLMTNNSGCCYSL